MNELVSAVEKIQDWGGMKKDIAFLSLSLVSLVLSMAHVNPFPFDIAWIAIILSGVPIILEAAVGLITAFDIKADLLVSLALIASVAIGEDFAAGEVAFIMQLGGLLEELTVSKARAGIEKLVHLTPRTARIVEGEKETVVPAENVKVGQLIRILPGETIPVDGTIVSGSTSVNQAVMTGESLPVDKVEGDTVSSGTVNQFGSILMRAGKVGEDSSIQRMIRLVQSADAGKAKIVGLADKWATWVVVIALLSAGITWIVSGEIIRSVTILVVFCPCSMVLATPTAIMAAIGNATRHGFLVREGDALERLAGVKRITFDKTGTLTYGTPEVVAVVSAGELPEEDILKYAASSERTSEHPLGKAVVRSAKKNGISIPEGDDFTMLPGKGVSVVLDGKRILAGNMKLMTEENVTGVDRKGADKFLDEGASIIHIAVDGRALGFIALSDTLREEAPGVIRGVEELSVRPVLLTGDNEASAAAISEKVGIGEVLCSLLPEDKLSYIGESQKSGEPVCMIGDGINDAPALKKADVGIAMGGVGSDIAVESADIALVDDEIKELPHLLSLSKRMMKTITLNLSFSMTLNVVAIILAITGVLGPIVGALVHNAGSVLVIINSALLLGWKKRH